MATPHPRTATASLEAGLQARIGLASKASKKPRLV